MQIEEIFGKDGLIAQHLPSYEYREEQIQMAREIEEVIQEEGYLLVEAGTGVGKSLAYLVPFLKWAVNGEKRVIVSTYTKVLQSQLLEKDLPFLRKVLPFEFRAEACFGSANYLCLRRFYQSQLRGFFNSSQEIDQIGSLIEWQKATSLGLRQELDFEPSVALWDEVSRQGDLCFGKRCPYRQECYYQQARIRWFKSHLLIVNHHLYFANLAAEDMVLPPYDALVFDEAHSIEEVATGYLGTEVSNIKISYFLNLIYNPKTGRGFLNRLGDLKENIINKTIKLVDEVRLASSNLFQNILEKIEVQPITLRLREPNFVPNLLVEPLMALSGSLEEIKKRSAEEEEVLEVSAFTERCQNLALGISRILNQDEEDYVYWVEISKDLKQPKISLQMAPIDLRDEFRERIFEVIRPIVLTSATLTSNSSFDYLRSRIGLLSTRELILGSPFDYQNRVLLYLEKALPDPSTDYDGFKTAMLERVKELLLGKVGGAFVLFTSLRLVEEAYNFLTQEISGRKFFKQGDKPMAKLIEEFRQDEEGVLLGTNSFWQGVDVAGSALSLVIITKLPFAVPDEPIVEARVERLISQGKDPFMNYQVPQAVLMMRQGIGRLMRRKSDSGVIAILDPRLILRHYGRIFLASLPNCQKTNSLKEVNSFFSQVKIE
ncbi:TPA: helicase c2 [bacterium]|nr:helicase c2 [bacterium]